MQGRSLNCCRRFSKMQGLQSPCWWSWLPRLGQPSTRSRSRSLTRAGAHRPAGCGSSRALPLRASGASLTGEPTSTSAPLLAPIEEEEEISECARRMLGAAAPSGCPAAAGAPQACTARLGGAEAGCLAPPARCRAAASSRKEPRSPSQRHSCARTSADSTATFCRSAPNGPAPGPATKIAWRSGCCTVSATRWPCSRVQVTASTSTGATLRTVRLSWPGCSSPAVTGAPGRPSACHGPGVAGCRGWSQVILSAVPSASLTRAQSTGPSLSFTSVSVACFRLPPSRS
mmetsp:Transcript_79772/g.258412  ORF Transcript_79772/g.258412 Transcript_79772/m.258412 type:complete len:287 (-) Transcript_79772:195-1055(-)